MTDEASADFQRGLEAIKAGDRGGAFSGFLMALALEPDNSLYRRHALDILSTSGGYTTLPEPILDALAGCADDPALDLQPLALVVKLLLPHQASLKAWLNATSQHDTDVFNRQVEDGLFDDLTSDPLIATVLLHTTNVSVVLEDILTGIRRHTLTQIVAKKPAPFLERYDVFFDALVAQANHSDFAWAEAEEETCLIEKLSEGAGQTKVRQAYRQTNTAKARSFIALTSISDPVSQIVQAQYTAYPYPRWETVPAVTPKSLYDAMDNRFPTEAWPERFKRPAKGLSAGCGTGRGTVMLALSIKDLDLTAIDLSPTSLTFAADKASELGLSNIAFGLGDILESDSMGKTFDMIECSGVLHHMNDPATGLIALKQTLAVDGVMRIALYSERARSAVVAARTWLTQKDFDDSPDELRNARRALRALPNNHPAKAVIETPDFFNLSGLHDLIFNVQEHRFTPKDLKALLEQAGLRFLGFDHFNLAVPGQYADFFGTHADQTDLDKWDAFEQNNPNTFSEMYQIWCRPTA